jgi:hypothetical protein
MALVPLSPLSPPGCNAIAQPLTKPSCSRPPRQAPKSRRGWEPHPGGLRPQKGEISVGRSLARNGRETEIDGYAGESTRWTRCPRLRSIGKRQRCSSGVQMTQWIRFPNSTTVKWPLTIGHCLSNTWTSDTTSRRTDVAIAGGEIWHRNKSRPAQIDHA